SAGLPSASADSSHEEPPIASQRRSPALSLATTEPPAAATVSPTVMTDTVELLDPAFGVARTPEVRGLAGGTGSTVALRRAAQDGRSGLPVAAAPAHLRAVASLVPPAGVDPGPAGLLAATAAADPLRGQPCATHAESTGADEGQADRRAGGHHRLDGAPDHRGDPGRATGCYGPCRPAPRPVQAQRGVHRQGAGRDLASGAPVRPATGLRSVSLSPSADRGVRRTAAGGTGEAAEPFAGQAVPAPASQMRSQGQRPELRRLWSVVQGAGDRSDGDRGDRRGDSPGDSGGDRRRCPPLSDGEALRQLARSLPPGLRKQQEPEEERPQKGEEPGGDRAPHGAPGSGPDG